MTDKARPLNATEKKTAAEAYNLICVAVDGGTRLPRLLEQAFKECKADFKSADIGRWHVIEAFVRGHRGDISLAELHREYDGYMHAAIVGAGFRGEKPEYDVRRIYELADVIADQRKAWRARA
ncbi:hypothetical protein [Sphingomonas sp. 3-13AW]|uniref:hypothetical protein n=1 Tax=Sphingomonas sp. 3-13AW TaxID=3050450 RepID=UPI003BB6DC32